MFDILERIFSLANVTGGVVAIISIATAVIIAAATVAGVYLTSRGERRARDNIGIEQRRLTEVNIRVGDNVKLTATQKIPLSPLPSRSKEGEAATEESGTRETAFMVLRLPLMNIGDGPVDILGMLVSARVLSAAHKPGIGTRSRDVEWKDYQALYWSDTEPGQVFSGISTTKHLVTGAQHFIRLAAKESTTMRRIDAVNNVCALREQGGRVDVMYKIFMVARGYPLGEILRQLGGGPPEPALNVRQELLRFQTLAQPDYHRWQMVQLALINLNRFVFRLAIYDPHDLDNHDEPGDSPDPLGLFTEADAWRMFLLHHWEFVDDVPDAAPESKERQAQSHCSGWRSEHRGGYQTCQGVLVS